jgi:hypothetical protein
MPVRSSIGALALALADGVLYAVMESSSGRESVTLAGEEARR